ncbi:MAG: hypothetical protein ACK2UB_07375, partial [Anaerolineales bacterium]
GKAVLEEGPGRSGVAQDDWESPNAVRMQKGSAAVGEADDLPVPIPSPGVKRTKAEPSLIPENNTAPDAGSSGEADSLPLPIPSPKGTDRPAESGRPPGMDPDPVDSTKVPTGEQVSATPITLPGKPGAGKAARGEADSLPIPIPSPKEASSGPAIDPSMDEQLKQRKEQAANDDESAEV